MNFSLFTSMTIVGILLISVLSLQSRYKKNSVNLTLDQIAMRDVHNLQEIVNYDFKKIGYDRLGKISNAITMADSNRIQFQANLDNLGAPENVTWDFSNNSVTTSMNPNDHVLTRNQDGVITTFNNAGVVKFRITYYQQGSDVPMTFPIAILSQIKRIKVEIVCESLIPSIGENLKQPPKYVPSTWQEVFIPRNL